MGKYSYETKKKVVMASLNGEGGYRYLARKYHIGHECLIRTWKNTYLSVGDEGLMPKQHIKYSYEFKLHVVELYLTSDLSYKQLAIAEGVRNHCLIALWVGKYRKYGADALKPKRMGVAALTQTANEIHDTNSANMDKQYVKKLEEENLHLRIEVAYLKELRRLRLAEEKHLKQKRELSTVSEENSN